MKGIITFFILYFPIFSSAQTESITFKIKIAEEMITFQFGSVKDFEENYESYLDDFEVKEDKKRKKTSESFWVEISISIIDDKASTVITRSINSNESNIKEDTAKLKKEIFNLLTVL